MWLDNWRAAEDNQSVSQNIYGAGVIVCVVTAIVWGLYWPALMNDRNRFGLWLATGAWLGMTIVTILISKHQPQVVLREVNLLVGYASGLAVARLFRSPDRYATILIVVGAIQSIIAIDYQSRGINTLVSGNIVRAGGTFDTPSDLYLISLFILPLAVQKVISADKIGSSVFYMLCCSGIFAALALTWDRTGFAAVCIGLYWLVRKQMTSRMQLVCFGVVLLLICGVFVERSSGPVNYTSSTQSIDSRSLLFSEGVSIFSHHWLNGIGIGCLSLPVSATILGQVQSVVLTQPYNLFLYWLDEMGIFGGVLITVFFVFVYKTLAASSSKFSLAVGAVWISIVVAGMFNTLFGCIDFSCGNLLIGSLLGITMRLTGEDAFYQS